MKITYGKINVILNNYINHLKSELSELDYVDDSPEYQFQYHYKKSLHSHITDLIKLRDLMKTDAFDFTYALDTFELMRLCNHKFHNFCETNGYPQKSYEMQLCDPNFPLTD